MTSSGRGLRGTPQAPYKIFPLKRKEETAWKMMIVIVMENAQELVKNRRPHGESHALPVNFLNLPRFFFVPKECEIITTTT